MKTEVVAEIAQGFEGSVELSKLFVKAAATAGADSVKFQLVYADELATKDYEHYSLFQKLEIDQEKWNDIKNLCTHYGIELIFDIFGEKSLSVALRLGIKTVKIHPTDITNDRFLMQIAKSNLNRVILGAGGAFYSEIKSALEILSEKELVLLLGFQGYPTELNENQISRLKVWDDMFCTSTNVKLGFSDHADPNSVSALTLPAYAVGAGVTLIEKHLTLGICMELEDFESAMNPDQFKHFVDALRSLEECQGFANVDEDFGMSKNEKRYRLNVRRDVVAAHDIDLGSSIGEDDVVLKRSSAQNAFKSIKQVKGKRLKVNIAAGTPISTECIEE